MGATLMMVVMGATLMMVVVTGATLFLATTERNVVLMCTARLRLTLLSESWAALRNSMALLWQEGPSWLNVSGSELVLPRGLVVVSLRRNTHRHCPRRVAAVRHTRWIQEKVHGGEAEMRARGCEPRQRGTAAAACCSRVAASEGKRAPMAGRAQACAERTQQSQHVPNVV
eukprot:6199884-Pleurochrysis_carterae.AAC.2